MREGIALQSRKSQKQESVRPTAGQNCWDEMLGEQYKENVPPLSGDHAMGRPRKCLPTRHLPQKDYQLPVVVSKRNIKSHSRRLEFHPFQEKSEEKLELCNTSRWVFERFFFFFKWLVAENINFPENRGWAPLALPDTALHNATLLPRRHASLALPIQIFPASETSSFCCPSCSLSQLLWLRMTRSLH